MENKQDIIDLAYQRAYHYEAEKGSCPQCVLASLKETLHIGDDHVFQAAHGLTGGTSLSSEGTCGALACRRHHGTQLPYQEDLPGVVSSRGKEAPCVQVHHYVVR